MAIIHDKGQNWFRFMLVKYLIIPLEHKRIKRKTKKYWDELEAAQKTGDLRLILRAGAKLNQALLKYYPQ